MKKVKFMVGQKEYYAIMHKSNNSYHYEIQNAETGEKPKSQMAVAKEYFASKGIMVNKEINTHTLIRNIINSNKNLNEYFVSNPEIRKQVRKRNIDESHKFDKHLSQELIILRDLILESILQFAPDFIAENLQFHDLGCPHQPELPPKGHSTVYLFKYRDEYLKIGKAGVNSGARVLSQHYYVKSPSSLSKSILKDKRMNHLKLNVDTVGEWIKQNCRRINIYIKDDDVFIYNYVEAMLQLKYQPRYEGKH